jgi:hypothetical protein
MSGRVDSLLGGLYPNARGWANSGKQSAAVVAALAYVGGLLGEHFGLHLGLVGVALRLRGLGLRPML